MLTPQEAQGTHPYAENYEKHNAGDRSVELGKLRKVIVATDLKSSKSWETEYCAATMWFVILTLEPLTRFFLNSTCCS